MELLGRFVFGRAAEDHSLIADMYRILPSAVDTTGGTRFVGYRGILDGGQSIDLFGMEVVAGALPSSHSVEDDLVVATFGSSSLALFAAGSVTADIRAVETLRWKWRRPRSGRPHTGEFEVDLTSDFWPRGHRGTCLFRLFADAYYRSDPVDRQEDQDEGSAGTGGGPAGDRLIRSGNLPDDVQLVEYRPEWPAEFEAIRSWLRQSLGPRVVSRIEHYGSTAVPGMPAKPIIDVIAEVASFESAAPAMIPVLQGPLWEYWWYSDHMIFIKRKTPMGERECHIHVAPAGHPVWRGTFFRDCLIASPEERDRYAVLKRELAARFPHDRERYTQEKEGFITEITQRAAGKRQAREDGGMHR